MSGLRILFAALALLAGAASAQGQGLAFGTSDPRISINSNFSGETITLFGNIELGADRAAPPGIFDVVMVVRGPSQDRVVRRKDRQFGLILNADHALFTRLPSFYRVLSSSPLDTILDPETIATWRLTPHLQARAALAETTGEAEEFEAELIRLLTNADFYGMDERGAAFLSPTLFSGRIALPAHVPNGVYLAQIFVVHDGRIVVEGTQSFSIQKEGFERFVAESATADPLAYGLATVFLALVTGWLGGVLFRR